MEMSLLLSFAFIQFTLSVIPGPAVLITSSAALRSGMGAGLRAACGVLTGNAVYVLVACLGVQVRALWADLFAVGGATLTSNRGIPSAPFRFLTSDLCGSWAGWHAFTGRTCDVLFATLSGRRPEPTFARASSGNGLGTNRSKSAACWPRTLGMLPVGGPDAALSVWVAEQQEG